MAKPSLFPLPLIDINPSNFPIGFAESFGSALDIFVARLVYFGFVFAVYKKTVASNTTTQRSVEY
jgi:hypothetical protein